jgi:hypothetical protein
MISRRYVVWAAAERLEGRDVASPSALR